MNTAVMRDQSSTALPAKGEYAETGSRRTIVMLALAAGLTVISWGAYRLWNGPDPRATSSATWAIPAKFDASRAFQYLEQVVAFGPRPSGSEAMEKQQAFLQQFFTERGGEVEMQTFEARHPQTGERVTMKNVIARFRREAPRRFLLCAHYDTRPFPDRDPVNPKGVFLGANDGGSGTAALMEFSHHIDSLPADVGVDLVLFDGEELVFNEDEGKYFLGSEYFAQRYVEAQEAGGADFKPYVAGVLLDMVGDKELQFYYERNSWNYARDVTVEIWSTAKRLGISAFQARIRHTLRDDHLPLNQIAKIPTTDIIDFDYPRPGFRHQSYWHTTNDTLDNCSGDSLAAVVYVVHTWISNRR